MTLDEFCNRAFQRMGNNPHLRSGQAFFNQLAEDRPELAERVRGTHLDPFYDDAKLGVFTDFIEANWEVPT